MSPTTSHSCSAEPVQRGADPRPPAHKPRGTSRPREGWSRRRVPGCKPPAPPAPGASYSLSRLHGILTGVGGGPTAGLLVLRRWRAGVCACHRHSSAPGPGGHGWDLRRGLGLAHLWGCCAQGPGPGPICPQPHPRRPRCQMSARRRRSCSAHLGRARCPSLSRGLGRGQVGLPVKG